MNRSFCRIEALEGRRMLSASIGSLSADALSVERGQRVTLTANDVSSDTKVVSFYVDSNGNGVLDDGDKKLNSDGTAANGFTGRAQTKKLPVGDVMFFAQGRDADGNLATAQTSVHLTNASPTLKRLTPAPKKIAHGKNLRLIANGAHDTDGTIASVSFYVDSNGNGLIDVGTDLLISTDSSKNGGFKASLDTTPFAVGTMTILAQATDSDGGVSNVVSATVTVT
jgi:hypothetical protein